MYGVTFMQPIYGPLGFWGYGEKGHLFSGSCGVLVIILLELKSKLIVLGFREPCQKYFLKISLKREASILFDFLNFL